MDDVHDVEAGDDSPEARFGGGLRRMRVQVGVSVRLLVSELNLAHSSEPRHQSLQVLAGASDERAAGRALARRALRRDDVLADRLACASKRLVLTPSICSSTTRVSGSRSVKCAYVTTRMGAALVEKQGEGVGTGPVGAFVRPARGAGAQIGWIGISRTLLTLAEDPQDAPAR